MAASRQRYSHTHASHHEDKPRQRRALVSGLISVKVIGSVFAFKTLEVVLHQAGTGHLEMTALGLAGLGVVAVAAPALGLMKVLEQAE